MRVSPVFFSAPSLPDFIDDWIPYLPQSDRIDLRAAENWYHKIKERGADNFGWYFVQLKKLTDVDAASIVYDAMGYQIDPPLLPLERIIAQKLMQETPRNYDFIMRRDLYSKVMIKRIFHEDCNAVSQSRLTRILNDHTLSWMTSSVDEVVEISRNNDVFSAIVSYQVGFIPEGATNVYNQIILQMADYLLADAFNLAHVHLDEIELRSTPLYVDLLMNVQFDFASGATRNIVVPYDGKLTRKTIETCDNVWQHIIKGGRL